MTVKRKRAETTEMAFSVGLRPPSKNQKIGQATGVAKKDFFLRSGFSSDLNNEYTITPRAKWVGMKKYDSFANSPVTKEATPELFAPGNIVFVNNPKSMDGKKKVVAPEDAGEYWIAKVVEIRAIDATKVFVLVEWLYWPSELPDGKQEYHAPNELVASNHLDVIEAVCISCKWEVTEWREGDEEDLPSGETLFWRQTHNLLKDKKHSLSKLRKHCVCGQYFNPDKSLVKCENKDCNLWLHAECIVEDAASRKHDELMSSDFKYASQVDDKSDIPWKGLLYGIFKGDRKNKTSDWAVTVALKDTRFHTKESEPKEGDKGFWIESAKCPGCGSVMH